MKTDDPIAALPASVRLVTGRGGLPVLRIEGPAAVGEIYLHGATVTGWTPRGSAPVLFVSSASRFTHDTAIRGGVPICFPWFGARAGHPESPSHGFARLSDWSLVGAQDDGEDITVRLRLTDSGATGASAWPHRFEALYTVVVGSRLSLALTVTNRGEDPLVFEEALHTYLNVDDIRSTEVTGLEGTAFHDSVSGPDPVADTAGPPLPRAGRVSDKPQLVPGETEPLRFTAETDRIYLDTGTTTLTVRDTGTGRSVQIAKDGSGTTVAWSPWVDKAARLPDLGNDEWTRMLCVEVSNIRDAAICLAPAESHTMTATFEEHEIMTEHRSPTYLRGRVVTPTSVIEDGAVVVDGDTIVWVGPAGAAGDHGWPDLPDASEVPATLLPGLVDLHNHGGGGAGFPDASTPEQARVAIHEHLTHGTTTLVASLVTATPDTLRRRVGVLTELAASGELAGIHLEGPFLATALCGAQDPDLIQAPDAGLVRELTEAARGHVVTMTLAPELEGVLGDGGVIDALVAAGALPSFGHTDASWAQTRAAVTETRARLEAAPGPRSRRPTATHLFNRMRPLTHRDPGPIPELLAAAGRGDLVVELIGDGTHLAPELVASIFELVGARNIALVTDAMAAAGMSDGAYRLGSLDVTVSGGVARLTKGGAIAGGTAHLLDVVRTTVAGGVPLADAVLAASTTPATVLGDPRVGALEAGRRADVVITDPDLWVVQVLRAGRVVHPAVSR
ncbi:MAG TPA: amidohydrolase family protein [Dermatophilaceae bacterium]